MDSLEQAVALLEQAKKGYATYEDVAELMDTLIDFVKDAKENLQNAVDEGDTDRERKIAKAIALISAVERRMDGKLRSFGSRADRYIAGEFKKVRAEFARQMKGVSKLIPEMPDLSEIIDRIIELENKEEPMPDIMNIRNGFEVLQGDDRLSIEAISGIDDYFENNFNVKIKAAEQNSELFPFRALPALWALADMALSGIVAGQSIQWDGVKWIPYTPAGSGGTPVWAEDLTPQGPGTAFTLAHTPIVGSVRLFRGGAYQSVANGDYSIAGANITLSPALANGEVLVADYSY